MVSGGVCGRLSDLPEGALGSLRKRLPAMRARSPSLALSALAECFVERAGGHFELLGGLVG